MGSLDSASLGMGASPGSTAVGAGLGSAALGSLGSSASADGSLGTPEMPGSEQPGSGGGQVPPAGPVEDEPGTEPGQGPDGSGEQPQKPSAVGDAPQSGHNGAPGKPTPARTASQKQSELAVTGTDVMWLGGAALVLVAGGSWLLLRTRRSTADEQ